MKITDLLLLTLLPRFFKKSKAILKEFSECGTSKLFLIQATSLTCYLLSLPIRFFKEYLNSTRFNYILNIGAILLLLSGILDFWKKNINDQLIVDQKNKKR